MGACSRTTGSPALRIQRTVDCGPSSCRRTTVSPRPISKSSTCRSKAIPDSANSGVSGWTVKPHLLRSSRSSWGKSRRRRKRLQLERRTYCVIEVTLSRIAFPSCPVMKTFPPHFFGRETGRLGSPLPRRVLPARTQTHTYCSRQYNQAEVLSVQRHQPASTRSLIPFSVHCHRSLENRAEAVTVTAFPV